MLPDHDLTEKDPERFRDAIRRLSERERAALARLRRLGTIDITDSDEPVDVRFVAA